MSGSPSNYFPNNRDHQVSLVFHKKNKRQYYTPENYKHKQNVPENYKHTLSTPQQKSADKVVVDDEITFLKQTYQQESADSSMENKMEREMEKSSLKKDSENMTTQDSSHLQDSVTDRTEPEISEIKIIQSKKNQTVKTKQNH